MTTCNNLRRYFGHLVERTCVECGLGRCRYKTIAEAQRASASNIATVDQALARLKAIDQARQAPPEPAA